VRVAVAALPPTAVTDGPLENVQARGLARVWLGEGKLQIAGAGGKLGWVVDAV